MKSLVTAAALLAVVWTTCIVSVVVECHSSSTTVRSTFVRNPQHASLFAVSSATKQDIPSVLLVRGGESNVMEEDEDESEYDEDVSEEYDEEDEEEEEEEEVAKQAATASLAASAIKSANKAEMKKVAAAKEIVNAKLTATATKKKRKNPLKKYVPYILRACVNPFTVFAMTKAYFGSLFNLNYLKKQEPTQELRSALEDKAKRSPSMGKGGGGKGKRKMKPGQSKSLSDLPQLSS